MAAKIAKSATSQATSSVTCIASKGSSISAAAAPHAALLQSLPRPLRFSAFAAICIACAYILDYFQADHGDFRSDRPEIMNVIDSDELRGGVSRKPAS